MKAGSKEVVAKKAAQSAKHRVVFSNPFFTKDIPIATTPAQMVFDASYSDCEGALRRLSTVLPTLASNQSDVAAVNGAVDRVIKKALDDLRVESERLKKVAEDNGITIAKLSYTNVVTFEAKVTCNKAGQFLLVIEELDKLMSLIHATWIAGFIADDAKSSLERQWRRKMISAGADIQAIANRALNAYEKKVGKVEGEDSASVLDDASKALPGAEMADKKKVGAVKSEPKAKRTKIKAPPTPSPAMALAA